MHLKITPILFTLVRVQELLFYYICDASLSSEVYAWFSFFVAVLNTWYSYMFVKLEGFFSSDSGMKSFLLKLSARKYF
jgi:hypothetical protein